MFKKNYHFVIFLLILCFRVYSQVSESALILYNELISQLKSILYLEILYINIIIII